MPEGNSAVPDAEVLAFAMAAGRILLPHNRRPDSYRQAQRTGAAVTTAAEMTNKLIRVNRAARCRQLRSGTLHAPE
jgi:hypothetical protein